MPHMSGSRSTATIAVSGRLPARAAEVNFAM